MFSVPTRKVLKWTLTLICIVIVQFALYLSLSLSFGFTDVKIQEKVELLRLHKRDVSYQESFPLDGVYWSERDDAAVNLTIKTKSEQKTIALIRDNENQNDYGDIQITHHIYDHLQHIFFSVKTTHKFHQERLPAIVSTWVTLVTEQTYFFTDSDDTNLLNITHAGHVVNTHCDSAHNRKSLCCKMSIEIDYFLSKDHRWFCHVDDDIYVNIPNLLAMLQAYDHTEDWYIGRPSLKHPIKIANFPQRQQDVAFWFATGGAFCISRPLMLKMMPYAAGGKFRTVCDKIRLPDDVTIGFIISYYLNKELTVNPNFHTHLETLQSINKRNAKNIITASYGTVGNRMNHVDIPGLSFASDPTRFYSLHCLIFNIEPCVIPNR